MRTSQCAEPNADIAAEVGEGIVDTLSLMDDGPGKNSARGSRASQNIRASCVRASAKADVLVAVSEIAETAENRGPKKIADLKPLCGRG